MVGKIGILSLQGGFSKHEEMIRQLGVEAVQVRYPHELKACVALIIPGGESTVMHHLILERNFLIPIQQFAESHPLFGTCAGMILMAREGILGVMDLTVERNAYGRQSSSFSSPLKITFSPTVVEGVFIRAPRITSLHSPHLSVLADLGGEPVLVQQGFHLAASFHPELTPDLTIHRYFINQGERRVITQL